MDLNYLDQMVSINGWRDVHQSENPLKLYPGDGKPEIAFFWFSSVCKVIAPYLSVIPPIFNHCTETITREDEVCARDKYWVAITEEGEEQVPRSCHCILALRTRRVIDLICEAAHGHVA